MITRRGAWCLAAGLGCHLLFTGCGGEGGPGPGAPSTPTWQLQGTVSESGTNKRLAAARIEVIDGSNAGKSTVTDSNGVFRITGLTQGGFSVKASSAGHDSVTQGVTLTSDQTIDFSLPMGSPVLTLSFEPPKITVTGSGDPEYPNELDFKLSVQETNSIEVWVEALYFILATSSGDLHYWECDNDWLRQYYLPLRVGGGNTKTFRLLLIYGGPIEAGTLSAGVEVKDAVGNLYRVFGEVEVQPAASGRTAAIVGIPAGQMPRLAPTRR